MSVYQENVVKGPFRVSCPWWISGFWVVDKGSLLSLFLFLTEKHPAYPAQGMQGMQDVFRFIIGFRVFILGFYDFILGFYEFILGN